MPLIDLDLPAPEVALPGDVRSFLRRAGRRVERFQRTHCVPGFVPSDFARAYGVLRALAEADVAPGRAFCEWGSGFGVVTGLAAWLDFDACGIEIEGTLVDEARRLADEFGLPVEFFHGSFIPKGGEALAASAGELAWLTTDGGEPGRSADEFDVLFAYPWPDEEGVIEGLFDRYAALGAVLVTYHGGEEFRVRRKVGGRRGRPRPLR